MPMPLGAATTWVVSMPSADRLSFTSRPRAVSSTMLTNCASKPMCARSSATLRHTPPGTT